MEQILENFVYVVGDDMNCDDIRGLFSGYFDGQLDDTEAAEITAHFEGCEACAKEYEFFCKMINDIRKLPSPALPPGFHGMLMKRVRGERRKRRGVFMPYLTAAASVLLVVGLWFTFLPMFDGVVEPPMEYENLAEDLDAPIAIQPFNIGPRMVMDDVVAGLDDEVDLDERGVNWIPPVVALVGLLGIGLSFVVKRPWGIAPRHENE